MNGPPAHFGSRKERIAYNESWCRDLNRRKAGWIANGHATAGFRCECAQVNCGARFPLSLGEWNAIRSRPNRFAVAPEHVAPGIEIVLKRYADFWIVEKQGEAALVAEALD